MVVTSFNFEEVEEVADAGVESFIQKPFDPRELLSHVRYAVSKSRGHSGCVALLDS